LLPSERPKSKPNKKPARSKQQTENSAATCSRWFLACGFFYPEDGGITFLRNIGSNKIYMAPHHRRRHSAEGSSLQDPLILSSHLTQVSEWCLRCKFSDQKYGMNYTIRFCPKANYKVLYIIRRLTSAWNTIV
jgi:hypothetical protein